MNIRITRGLTYKQAMATLAIVVVLSLVSSIIELWVALRDQRGEALARAYQTLSLVQGSATEAAYQLNGGLAGQVVDGIAANEEVERVQLRDNFGKTLAEKSLSRQAEGSLTALLAPLFDEVTHYQLPLRYANVDGASDSVGQLDVTLSSKVLAASYVDRVKISVMTAVIRDLLISALVVSIFYGLITRPLLGLSRAISRVDPDRPGAWHPPRLSSHGGDELGLLVTSTDKLLQAFQRGLDQRDQAQADLMALNADLEKRVHDRTHELERTMQALTSEKAETERAFARLDQAHHELEKANRLIVESIQYARRIQTAVLPDKQALGDAVRDLYVWWEPLHVVGGDYFWLERIGPLNIIIVADCTGHGVPGAFITLVVASALDRILHEHRLTTPSAILRALDTSVRMRLRQDRPDTESDDGLDAAVCVWDSEKRTVTFAGAGLPLLYWRGGDVREVRGSRASLGYGSSMRERDFADHVIEVEPGMMFYLLTDGVSDHMGGTPRRLLGRKRLSALIAANAHLPMAEQIKAIQQALEHYRGEEPRRDDATLLGFTPL